MCVFHTQEKRQLFYSKKENFTGKIRKLGRGDTTDSFRLRGGRRRKRTEPEGLVDLQQGGKKKA